MTLDNKSKNDIEKQLTIIKIKARAFYNKASFYKGKDYNLHFNYFSAASKANLFTQDVNSYLQQLVTNEITLDVFKEKYNESLKNAIIVLKKHRGVKQLVGNIVLAIAGLLIFYLLACFINLLINKKFFFFQTDSIIQLNKLTKLIEGLTENSFSKELVQEVDNSAQQETQEYARKDLPVEQAQALLFQGCRELNYTKVLTALDNGADANQFTKYIAGDALIYPEFYYDENHLFSPLSLVAMYDSKEKSSAKQVQIAQLLLDRGADIDAVDIGDMGNTPLHWSLVNYCKPLTILFINHAKTHQKNVINMANKPAKPLFGSNPPLIMALKTSIDKNLHNLDMVELLINSGADVNVVDHFQQSPLHWAAIIRCPFNIFQLLIERGCVSQANQFGATPKKLYMTTICRDHIKVNSIFNENDYSKPMPNSFTEIGFHAPAFQFGGSEYAKAELLDALNPHNKEAKVIELLISIEPKPPKSILTINNSNINEQDNQGRTLLHRAVFYGNKEVFEALIEAEADRQIKDNSGFSPLELAQHLQLHFTYTVEHRLFKGNIRNKLCNTWEEFEKTLSEKHIPKLQTTMF